MADTIRLTYDPREAQRGLSQLDRSVESSSRRLETLGTTATRSTTNLSQGMNSVGRSAQQAVAGVGQIGSVVGTLGSTMGGAAGQALGLAGGLAGAAEAATGAVAALGPVGIAVGAAVIGVGYLVTKWQEAKEEARKAAEEATKAAEAQRKQAEAMAKQAEAAKQAQIANNYEAQISFAKELDQINQQAAAKREAEGQRRYAAEKGIEDVKKLQVALQVEERELMEWARESAERNHQSVETTEKLREQFQQKRAALQERSVILAEREKQILDEQAKKERELTVQREADQKALEESQKKWLQSIDEGRRKIETMLRARQQLIEKDANTLLQALSGGTKAADTLTKAISTASGTDGASGDVKRGRSQGPLQFAGGALASRVLGIQQATVASPFEYGANIGGPGSRDRLRNGGGGGQAMAGGIEGSIAQKIAAAIDPKMLAEQIAKNREGAIDKRQQGAVNPNDRSFDRDRAAARRGAFRGDTTQEERDKALGQLVTAQGTKMKLDQQTIAVIQQTLKTAQALDAENATQQSQLDALKAIQDALNGNVRKRALRAARPRP